MNEYTKEIFISLMNIQNAINIDKDGSYFICEEAKEIIDNMNTIIEKYNQICTECNTKVHLNINDGEMFISESYMCKYGNITF